MEKTKQKETRIEGLALSKGRAVGKVCLFNENRHSNLSMYKVEGEGIEREIARVDRAIEIAGERLVVIHDRVEERIGKAEAEIFTAQKMILEDSQLRKEVVTHITEENVNADYAITHVLDSYEARLQAIDDEYISARATDFGEIKRRLLDVMGNMQPSLQCDKKHCQHGKNRIIVADELTPTLTVDIDPDLTIGFVTEHGGVNSHAAILARALGIPAVSGLQGVRGLIGCGTNLLIDGSSGVVIIHPTDESIADFMDAETEAPRVEPVAVDPVKGFEVMANVSLPADLDECIRMNAEGVGLYRTEFEVMAAGRFFSEDELFDRYDKIAKAMAGKGVVFRLFDIGSDKAMPFMQIPSEENPALGWRGARLLLGRRDVLETQARALARISEVKGGRIKIMYPMIIDADQFVEIKSVFLNAIKDFNYGEILHGIMFEVPSACLMARELYELIDFASIGTNDLTQYLFAVDRDNELVSYDYNPDRAVFWKLMNQMADAAQEAGKPLSVCGELAGDPQHIRKLIDMGITSVSVSPRRITDIRKAAAELM